MEQLRSDPDILRLPSVWLCFSVASQREVSAWLTPTETLAFQRIAAQSRRYDWLAGRLAAKEVVRCYLLEARGLEPSLAQIEVLNNEDGAPTIYLEGRDWGGSLSLSIAHSEGHGLAGLGERGSIGVDLQKIRSVRAEFSERVLSQHERDQVAHYFVEREPEGLMVFWAMKEAAVKAQRTRPAPRWHKIEVTLTEPGRAEIRVKGQKLSALWGRRGEFIWTCALPFQSLSSTMVTPSPP